MAQPGGKYVLRVLKGAADDQQNANGVDVLDFHQAQEKARELAHGRGHSAPCQALLREIQSVRRRPG